MTAFDGGGIVSFTQLKEEPPDNATVVYEGRIAVPAGALIVEAYWYTRYDWNVTVTMEGVAEVGLLISGLPDTAVFSGPVDISTADTGGGIHIAAQPASAGKAVVSNADQDLVFTITETVTAGADRQGATLVGVHWSTPHVTVVGAPTITP